MDEESSLPGYYCWVRLIDLRATMQIMMKPKPVRPKSYVSPFPFIEGAAQSAAHQSACFHFEKFAQKPLTNAAFDIGPAFPDEESAQAWLRDDPGGRVWSRAALNYVLVGFSFDIPRDDQANREMSSATITDFSTLGFGGFPEADWDARFKAEFGDSGAPQVTIFGSDVALPLPAETAMADECELILSYANPETRTEDRKLEIIKEALRNDNLALTVLAPLGLSENDTVRCLSVANFALTVIHQAIFAFKAYFNRARPWNCCGQQLYPLFPKGSAHYPGHPSYPSGHSTQAHTLAYLFAMRYPKQRLALLGAADRIAVNREVAGLHFPSDSAAGKWLGKRFADAIANALPEFQDEAWRSFKNDFDALGGN